MISLLGPRQSEARSDLAQGLVTWMTIGMDRFIQIGMRSIKSSFDMFAWDNRGVRDRSYRGVLKNILCMDECMYVGKSKYHNHKALMYSISCHRSKKFKRYHRCVYIYLSRSPLFLFYFYLGCSVKLLYTTWYTTRYPYTWTSYSILLLILPILSISPISLIFYTMSEDFESLPPAVRRKVRAHCWFPPFITPVFLTPSNARTSHFPPQ